MACQYIIDTLWFVLILERNRKNSDKSKEKLLHTLTMYDCTLLHTVCNTARLK